MIDLSHKQCNGIIKGWLYCLTLESKGRFFVNTRSSSQKHFVIQLHEKLNFIHHIKEKNSKANEGVALIEKLNKTLPRKALLTLFKSFVKPHLYYGDIIYDQPNNESF